MRVSMLFSCLIVLAVVFGNTHSASAHETYTTTAKEASEMDTMEAMKNFLLHVKEHREKIEDDDQTSEFRYAMRTDDGEWNYKDTYVIVVNKKDNRTEAGGTIFLHAENPTYQSGSLRGVEIFRDLMTDVEQANGEAVCRQDSSGKYGNHICAVEATLTASSGATLEAIHVAGFHHEQGDVDFSSIKCPDFSPDDFGEDKGQLSADMVHDDETLKLYLRGVEKHITEELRRIFALYGNAPGALQKGIVLLNRLMPCWREWPWKDESIYFYMIRYKDEQYTIFNGLTPAYNDNKVSFYDGCIDVSSAVRRIAEADGEGFTTYYWDNPVKNGDEVVGQNGDPIPGIPPGTSVKRGYFIQTNFEGLLPTTYVLGSGIYPDGETSYTPESGKCDPVPDDLSETARAALEKFPKPDDGGCAIASGAGNKLEIAAFNLFLITMVLFLAVSRRSRSGGES